MDKLCCKTIYDSVGREMEGDKIERGRRKIWRGEEEDKQRGGKDGEGGGKW